MTMKYRWVNIYGIVLKLLFDLLIIYLHIIYFPVFGRKKMFFNINKVFAQYISCY